MGDTIATARARLRALPLLLVLFVASGAAALIYEVVWFQLLELVIGASSLSLAVLLGTFMGGMCLGSLWVPWLVPARWHPLRVYALLEAAVGLWAWGLIHWLPQLDRWYSMWAATAHYGAFGRAALAAVCLIPPTIFMGATLPVIARYVQHTQNGVAWLGYFYGGNIAGAVLGCLAAGFYLLRVLDMPAASGVAVAINAAAALLAFALSFVSPYTANQGSAHNTAVGRLRSVCPVDVAVAIALSGCSALGAEVVWTRLLSLTLGGTVYTFSIILAVFLAGLGAGSAAAAAATHRPAPRLHFGAIQLFLVFAIAWAHFQVTASIPYWPIEPTLTRTAWDKFQLDVLRAFWAIFPAACAWGASFPLALAVALRAAASACRPAEANATAAAVDSGRVVGLVYATNTLGAIAGSLSFSLLVIPLWGTQRAGQILVAMALVAALVVWGRRLIAGEPGQTGRRPITTIAEAATAAAFAVLALLMLTRLPHTPPELIAYGRFLPRDLGWAEVIYSAEGANASVAVSLLETGTRNFHVSGKIEASSQPMDMRLQRMLGHIPALVHPHPRSVLVVGCGAGVTAGTFLIYPEVERVVVCEIEPLIPKVVARYFADENYHLVDDPRVHWVYDDARHYILTTRETFDIITSDPIHPWVKGAASLYTREYFALCRARLNPGGLMTQWVPLYESDLASVKSELATFFAVFPDATIWSNDYLGSGYDVVLLGMRDPATIDLKAMEQKLASPQYKSVADSLSEVGFGSAFDLLGTYAGEAGNLATWLAGVPLNRDLDLRLQYLAGLGATYHREELIFREMLDQMGNHEPKAVMAGERQADFLRRVRREATASGDQGADSP